VGRSGGLASLWSDNVDIDIQNFSQRHINRSIIFLGDDPPWKLIGFCDTRTFLKDMKLGLY
jgi:hypothetical protein